MINCYINKIQFKSLFIFTNLQIIVFDFIKTKAKILKGQYVAVANKSRKKP